MQKLPEVQAAKDLMNEAIEWSAFKWLFEKAKVRETADRANAALDRLNRSVKARWNDEIKATYKGLSAKPRRPLGKQQTHEVAATLEIHSLIEKVIAADEAAHRARMGAEEAFEQAEKQMSARLAAEGCKKAIHSWVLHERAIRQAEALEKSGHAPE